MPFDAGARIPTALCFDVEDIVAPESDDAALWMADMLAAAGLTGSFMVMGELARLWERRGRRDVIEALKRHDLAFHSTWHSVHPTTAEICRDKDFAAGMDAVWDWDRQGWADAERVLGRPLLGWARTGNSWSPSVMGLMGRMGRAYAYQHTLRASAASTKRSRTTTPSHGAWRRCGGTSTATPGRPTGAAPSGCASLCAIRPA